MEVYPASGGCDPGSKLNTGMKLKLLWENSSPTTAFGAQNMALPDGDYSLLFLIYKIGTMYNSEVFPRYAGTFINYATAYESRGGYAITTRRLQHMSENIYSVSSASLMYGNSDITGIRSAEPYVIPYRIYGMLAYIDNRPDSSSRRGQTA